MNLFSDTDIFLATPTAARLYRDHVKDLPIVELYCNLDVASVAENRAFSNITELLLYGNLDLLELMRVCGVEERFITGNSSDFEKFRELCRIMPMLIGNSQYAFCHEALRRFFNCELTINSDNCETIWRRVSDALTKRKLGAYDCLKASRIKTIFVAASPTDDLKPYEALGSLDKDMSILPVFCPDRCFDIGKRGALEYFSEIEKITSVSICKVTLCAADANVIIPKAVSITSPGGKITNCSTITFHKSAGSLPRENLTWKHWSSIR